MGFLFIHQLARARVWSPGLTATEGNRQRVRPCFLSFMPAETHRMQKALNCASTFRIRLDASAYSACYSAPCSPQRCTHLANQLLITMKKTVEQTSPYEFRMHTYPNQVHQCAVRDRRVHAVNEALATASGQTGVRRAPCLRSCGPRSRACAPRPRYSSGRRWAATCLCCRSSCLVSTWCAVASSLNCLPEGLSEL